MYKSALITLLSVLPLCLHVCVCATDLAECVLPEVTEQSIRSEHEPSERDHCQQCRGEA